MRSSDRSPAEHGLTRLELLAILSALGLLALVAAPALAGSKPRSDAALCANNLRQLGSAALSYSLEHGGFPPRTTNWWPQLLQRYYGELDLLRCPADPVPASSYQPEVLTNLPPASASRAPRSYFINAWSDYHLATLSLPDFQLFRVNAYHVRMPEAAIPFPSDTILFGEKLPGSPHFVMDIVPYGVEDVSHVEHYRHRTRNYFGYGGSNHAMVDGSVRMLLPGQGDSFTNLWAVTDPWRRFQ